MKLIAKTAAVAALALAAAGANAQLYGEVGYLAVNAEAAGTDVNLGALSGVVGYGLHPNFAVEGMLALGVKDDKIGSTNVELEHSYGVFAKPRVMLNPNFELFGRLGYLEHKAKIGGVSESRGDWAYGLGANYYFQPSTYGTLGYMRLYDKDGIKADGWTVGVGMKF